MAAEEFSPSDAIGSFTDTWTRVMIDPRAFFKKLPMEGGLQPPLVFASICLLVGGIEMLLFGGGLKGLVGLVIFGIVRLFVGAAIFALIAQTLFGGRGDFEATFRVLAYASAVAVSIGLPVLKFFAALYGAYLAILGLEKAHSMDTVRTVVALLATVITGAVVVHALGLGSIVARTNPLFQ